MPFEVKAFRCDECMKLHEDPYKAGQCERSHESLLTELRDWKPESQHALRDVVLAAGRVQYPGVSDENFALDTDYDYPFLCEAVLYPILGKDDARSVLYRLNEAIRRERGEL